MKRRLLALLLVLFSCASALAQERYYNKEEGYSFLPPAGWERTAEPGKVSLIAPEGGPLASIDFVVEADDGLSLGEFVSQCLQIAGQDGAKTILQEDTEINGRPAVHLRLLYPIRGTAVQMETFIMLAHDRAFALTGMAVEQDFPAHAEVINSTLSSFRLEEGD